MSVEALSMAFTSAALRKIVLSRPVYCSFDRSLRRTRCRTLHEAFLRQIRGLPDVDVVLYEKAEALSLAFNDGCCDGWVGELEIWVLERRSFSAAA